MNQFGQYDDRVWDRFFDFVTQPVEVLTREEVQQELKKRGIDVTKAIARVQQAVAAAKARESLARARSRRKSVVQRLADVVAPAVSGLRERLRETIAANLQGTAQAAYFRKLESAASEDDLRTLLDDVERLNSFAEENDASETDGK